jgi:hypothetical protein
MWKEANVVKFEVYSRIFLEGSRKTIKYLSEDSWSQNRDLNPGLPAQEGVPTTRQSNVTTQLWKSFNSAQRLLAKAVKTATHPPANSKPYLQ